MTVDSIISTWNLCDVDRPRTSQFTRERCLVIHYEILKETELRRRKSPTQKGHCGSYFMSRALSFTLLYRLLRDVAFPFSESLNLPVVIELRVQNKKKRRITELFYSDKTKSTYGTECLLNCLTSYRCLICRN